MSVYNYKYVYLPPKVAPQHPPTRQRALRAALPGLQLAAQSPPQRRLAAGPGNCPAIGKLVQGTKLKQAAELQQGTELKERREC